MEPRKRLDRIEVLARVSLADVLTAELGHPRRSGGELWWPSVDAARPGTGKSPPTHIVGADANGIEHFKDFASGRSGTAVDVLIITRGLDFAGALRLLAERAGVVPGVDPGPRPPRPAVDAAPVGGPPSPEFARWVDACTDRLWATDDRPAAEARAWLAGRGYSEQILRCARIGFDPGVRRDPDWPRERRAAHGIPGIGGVTIPLFDRGGQLTYAQTRNLRWSPGSRWPKYVNPTRLVANPAVAFWADPGRHAGRPVVVVEGPTDALAVRQVGHDVVALIGAGHAANPAIAAGVVQSFGPDRPFVIMTDPDAAGRLAGEYLAAHLRAIGATVTHQTPGDDDLAALAARMAAGFEVELDRLIEAGLTAVSRFAVQTVTLQRAEIRPTAELPEAPLRARAAPSASAEGAGAVSIRRSRMEGALALERRL